MATVQKRPPRRCWYALYRVAGKQVLRSTGILHTPDDPLLIPVNHKKAKAKANQMEREDRAKNHNPDIKFSEYGYAFVAEWATHPDAVRRSRNVITFLCAILGKLEKGPLTVVDREHILRYKELRSRQVDGSTLNSELSTLHMLFQKALNEGLIPVNPVDLQRDRVFEVLSVRSLEIWEIKALLTITGVLDWRTCIYTGFYLGWHLVDIVYRRWADLAHNKSGQPILYNPGNSHRNPKTRLIHPVLMEHFDSIPRVNEFICPTLAKLERWTVDNHFAKLVEAAQLGPGVTFRCLRHTFAGLLGVPLKRLDTIDAEAVFTLPDIRVPTLPCQTMKS